MGRSRNTILPLENISNIIREESGMKVSPETSMFAMKLIEKQIKDIIERSIKIAESAKRITIEENDILIEYNKIIPSIQKPKIPKLTTERLIKSYGAKRVSDKAIFLIQCIIENYLRNIASKAKKITINANRKIITPNDLEIAAL